MRIEKSIQRIGYFWLPDNPEKKIPGLLSIEEGGNISLEILGLFDEHYRSPWHYNILLGNIDGEGEVTLVDCSYVSNKNYGDGVEVKQKNLIQSDYVFFGKNFNKKEDLKFCELLFRVEGLNDWAGISGVNIESANGINPMISYSRPNDIDININENIQLSLTYIGSWTGGFHGESARDHAEIYQETYLKISSDENIPFSELLSLIKKIANFFIFAINKPVSIEKITVKKKDYFILCSNGKETDILKDIQVYSDKVSNTTEIQEVSWHTMMFRYKDVDNLEDMINKWLKMYDTIDPSLDLYFSVQFSKQKYSKSQFLTLAQALEALHRRTIKKKKMTLRDRLRNLFKELDILYSEEEREEYIDKILNTRDYLSHYFEVDEGKVISDTDIDAYINTMELLLQIHFLILLGFNQDKVHECLKIGDIKKSVDY